MAGKVERVLIGAACVVIVVHGISAAGSSLIDRAIAQTAAKLELESSASTSAEAAHLTFTNRFGSSRHACVRPVVTQNSGTGRVEGVIVCTGAMAPYSTITLDSPYPVGAVRKMCSTSLGTLDWDRCSFTTEKL